jgi:hypothetical protein
MPLNPNQSSRAHSGSMTTGRARTDHRPVEALGHRDARAADIAVRKPVRSGNQLPESFDPSCSARWPVNAHLTANSDQSTMTKWHAGSHLT